MEGLISEEACNRNRKTRYSSADKNIFCIYWF